MPLALVPIPVKRPGGTVTATLGTSRSEADVAGSPFQGRVYRVAQTTVGRDEAQPGTATVDPMRRVSFPALTDVRKGDILLVPNDDDPSTTERAKALRVRRYADRVQVDLETGADG